MSVSRRLVAVSTTLGLATAGLLTAGSASVATGDGTGAAVNVGIDGTRTITMPTTLRPGVNKFVVRSERSGGFHIVQAAAGYTKAEALRDVAAGLGQGKIRPLKRFERNIDMVGGVYTESGDPEPLWVDLDPGTYWALDVEDRRPRPADVVTLTVTGAEKAAAMPDGPVLRAVNSTDFAKRPRAIPARGRLTFRNDSDQKHFVEMVRLRDDATMADFDAWMEELKSGNETPPPVEFGERAGTGTIDPGREMAMHYALKPGRYVMICWWPDASMGGMPHALMGMYRMIKVG